MINLEISQVRKLIREDKLVKFYQCKAWYGKNGIRQQALERDNYECQECKRQGKVSPAQNVHHIKEVKEYPELALVLDNTESVCIKCHNKEHKRLEKYIRKNKKVFDDEWW
ncbi:HNH endonuclease [Radiobacillus kanasensis]|uniref:HNH endonuclease n=1 Tax=Radiobacillus kanasensis TaxID=2844358 RepID=UPI002ED824E4